MQFHIEFWLLFSISTIPYAVSKRKTIPTRLFFEDLLKGEENFKEYSASSSSWARVILILKNDRLDVPVVPVLKPTQQASLMDILGSLKDLRVNHNILVDIGREDILNRAIEDIDRFESDRVTYLFRMFKGPNGNNPRFNRSSAIEIVRRFWHSRSPICLAFTSNPLGNETSYTMEQVELIKEIEKTVFKTFTKFIELDAVLFSRTNLDVLKELASLIPTIILASDKGNLENAVDVPKLRYNVERVGVDRFLFDISKQLYNSIDTTNPNGALKIPGMDRWSIVTLLFIHYL